MPFNGAGSYSRSNGVNSGTTTWDLDRLAGTKITSARHDTHDNDIATALSNCVCRDGQSTISADMPFAGFKLTNIGEGTARTSAARVSQAQDSALMWGGTTAGTGDLQTLNLSPAITAYVSGLRIAFRAGNTNTIAPGLNVNGVGNKAIRTASDAALPAGYIRANHIYEVVYHSSFNGASGGWAIVSKSDAYTAETALVWTGTNYVVKGNTSNGSDTGYFSICAGGAEADGRGARITGFGADHGSFPGQMYLISDGGDVHIWSSSDTLGKAVYLGADGTDVIGLSIQSSVPLIEPVSDSTVGLGTSSKAFKAVTSLQFLLKTRQDYTAGSGYATTRTLNNSGSESTANTAAVLNTLIGDLITAGLLQ